MSKWKVESTRGYNQRLTQKTAQILENDLNRVSIITSVVQTMVQDNNRTWL